MSYHTAAFKQSVRILAAMAGVTAVSYLTFGYLL